ncbi:hypothetical protein BY458DRAFT_524360 [Sporodiniella umbellata]|nr:hypothetical protein BY458DRAFT_524360 [Sporodiniella umbellata]
MNDTITDSNSSLDKIVLNIKSLEQHTTSISLPRSASVMQLKHEIQTVFQVECDRQRLIFQGRVLKDDRLLKDYANLDDGKVIHLVIRPVNAPHNPSNDDPNTAQQRRPLSSLPSRLPVMEGYAFITLDSTISDLGDSNSLFSSLLNSLSNVRNRSTDLPSHTPITNRSPGLPSFLRSPLSFNFNQRAGEQRPPVSSGFPPSVEVRLARTLASMRNVRNMLNESTPNEDSTSMLRANSTAEQLHEIRSRLGAYGDNQLAQVATALDELADLITEAAPRMRQVAQVMRNALNEEDRDINRRVLFASRIVQGMSLINHFMGSVLATVDVDSRRQRPGIRPVQSESIRTTRADVQLPRVRSLSNIRAPLEENDESIKTEDLPLPSASISRTKKRKNRDNVDQPSKKNKPGKGKDKKE